MVVQVVGLIWKGTSFSVLNLIGSVMGISLVVFNVGQAIFDPALQPM